MKLLQLIHHPTSRQKTKAQNWLFGLLVILLVNACATRVTSLKKGTLHQLTEDQGFVLLGIESNRNLKMVKISGPQNIELSSIDIKEGTNYLLVDLEAGIYTIDRVILDDYWMVKLDEDDWQFEVKPDGISYVGHLEVARGGFFDLMTSTELVNRTSQALEFLEKDYTKLLSSHTVVYGGPAEDHFLSFLAELKKDLP